MIVTLLIALAMLSGGLLDWFVGELRAGLALNAVSTLDMQGYDHLLGGKIISSFKIIAPLALVGCLASITSSIMVGGLSYSPKALKLDLSRINVVKGFQNLLSVRSLVNLAVSLLKLGVLLGIIWHFISSRMNELMALRWAAPATLLSETAGLIGGLLGRIAVAICVIAVGDWLFQKWNYRRQLRMTKEEVRQERKNQEMAPQLRGRIRGVQFEMARKRMLQEVPQADVVIVNPTHVAVALKYQAGAMEAPKLLAKGPDLLCEKIKEIARAHNVPIVQKPELARTIYKTVEIGQAIPEALFVAVAEVLAMVYRAKRAAGAAT